MRLFVAVDIDDRTRGRVARAIDASPLRDGGGTVLARVSWIAPDRLHLTLQFIGRGERERGRRSPDPAPPCLRYACLRDALRVASGPSRRRSAPAWCGSASTAARTASRRCTRTVQRRLEDVAFSARITAILAAPHRRPLQARWHPRGCRAHRPARAWSPSGGCTIDHVTLYQSRLSPRGPTYTPLLVTPLAAEDAGT